MAYTLRKISNGNRGASSASRRNPQPSGKPTRKDCLTQDSDIIG